MSTLDSSDAISLHYFLTIILIVVPLGATLIPIIGTLIFFTPTESRKRPVFVLNILACLLGICQAVFFASLNTSVVLHPDKPVSHITLIAAIAILLAPPILIDSILLLRLLAFYPIQLTPHNTLIAILTPTFLIKAARLACLIAFLVAYPVSRLDAPGYVAVRGLVWGRGPWVIALFALQALDNSYVSSMFLYKLYCFGYTTQKAVGGSSRDIFSRVPAVFIIALGNYVVPVTIDITVIALMILLPDWSSGVYILFVANFITILGIVFATVWTTNQNWILRRMVEAGVDARTQSTMRFQTKSIADAFSVYDPYDTPDLFPA
ncbi:hypothetical protein B0F90DRAFT_1815742 [Multifurca ochricompacta]|uniref:Uncharacterized protein n=1 Tax=Multifurca ochricompacta TaxID=376703 RepID=A0AAD4M7Z6_9AGAM|nr:hypothetical protein B0F90DRAFT_1815742 [Multifurca ochricompacta]